MRMLGDNGMSRGGIQYSGMVILAALKASFFADVPSS